MMRFAWSSLLNCISCSFRKVQCSKLGFIEQNGSRPQFKTANLLDEGIGRYQILARAAGPTCLPNRKLIGKTMPMKTGSKGRPSLIASKLLSQRCVFEPCAQLFYQELRNLHRSRTREAETCILLRDSLNSWPNNVRPGPLLCRRESAAGKFRTIPP